MISKSPSTNPTAILGMFFYNLLIYKIILIPMNKQAKNGNAIKRLTFCTPPGCFIRYFFPNIFHIIIPKTKPIIIEHTRTIKVIVIFLLVFILSTPVCYLFVREELLIVSYGQFSFWNSLKSFLLA